MPSLTRTWCSEALLYCAAQDDADEAPRPQKATLAAGLSRLQLGDLSDRKLASAVSERDRTILALTRTNEVRAESSLGTAADTQHELEVGEGWID